MGVAVFDETNLPSRPSKNGDQSGAEGDLERSSAAALEDDAPTRPRLLGAVRRWRWWRWLVWPILLIMVVYYPLGMIITHRIDDDLDFWPAEDQQTPGGSVTVDMTAALVDRQVNDAGWVPNNPFFYGSAPLDNMPNYQRGLLTALFRFAIELTDQIGRTRGSSRADPDLDAAAGELKFPTDVWVWDLSISLLPTATTEQHYRRAITLLREYNVRLANGDAVFDRRADNLLGTLDRFAADIGSASAEIDRHVRSQGNPFLDTRSDDVFYSVKGRLYGYLMILQALSEDFGPLIAERQLDAAWEQMSQSLREAVALDPLFVLSGAPDGAVPSHLVAQGFYLMRARTQLREITNILLK